MASEDEWVDVSDAVVTTQRTNERESAADQRATKRPNDHESAAHVAEHESEAIVAANVLPLTMEHQAAKRLAAYNAFVSDASSPAPVFRTADLCYVLRFPGSLVNEVKSTARACAGCNACVSRAGVYTRDLGPAGAMLFSRLETNRVATGMSHIDTHTITKLRELAVTTCLQEVKPELVVVTSSTYAPAAQGCKPCGTPFYHWTVHPSAVSSPAAAGRFEKLKNYYGQMDTRLAKLTVPEAVASVTIMLEENPKLERPNHYTSVLKWVQGVQKAAAECASAGGCFEAMTQADQAKLRVFAIMSGRVDGEAHLDFHQADNVVDFLLMPSREALRTEMDRRSDPNYYMVSQLNRRLAAEGVTSEYLIGLTWDGQYADDLDIHVSTPRGSVIYYGNKSADGCKLDFDANVSKGEANPCENVSVRPGKFTVRVNNYTRRTFDKPIPFQVVCRQKGVEDVVYEGTWEVNRTKDAMIEVCRHEFSAVPTSGDVGMSAKSASRATALEAEWAQRIGEPSAVIATLDALQDTVGLEVVLAATGKGQPPSATPAAKTAAQVGEAFMGLALGAKDGNRAKKPFLSESCRAQPTTITELIAHLKAHPDTSLAIEPRDHSPGYLVSIGTKSADVRKTERPAPCHFHDKHSYPVKPVAGTVGNARLDASWLPTHGATAGGRRLVRVEAVVSAADSCIFFALQGATLPVGAEAFPLASGFYPTDLCADLHVHRERWTFFHTQLKPSMPPRVMTPGQSNTVPMVGAFLTAATATVYVDGVKMTLKCS